MPACGVDARLHPGARTPAIRERALRTRTARQSAHPLGGRDGVACHGSSSETRGLEAWLGGSAVARREVFQVQPQILKNKEKKLSLEKKHSF